MVVKSMRSSASQKAVSQLLCWATVLKGSPAMKAPTAAQETGVKGQGGASVQAATPASLPLAIRATTAWEVPQKREGALSLAITPIKATGP